MRETAMAHFDDSSCFVLAALLLGVPAMIIAGIVALGKSFSDRWDSLVSLTRPYGGRLHPNGDRVDFQAYGMPATIDFSQGREYERPGTRITVQVGRPGRLR